MNVRKERPAGIRMISSYMLSMSMIMQQTEYLPVTESKLQSLQSPLS